MAQCVGFGSGEGSDHPSGRLRLVRLAGLTFAFLFKPLPSSALCCAPRPLPPSALHFHLPSIRSPSYRAMCCCEMLANLDAHCMFAANRCSGRTISGGVVRSWHDEWWRSSAPADDVWHGGKQAAKAWIGHLLRPCSQAPSAHAILCLLTCTGRLPGQ